MHLVHSTLFHCNAMRRYTSFFSRRSSLLLQAASVLYKVSRMRCDVHSLFTTHIPCNFHLLSPHPDIRLLASVGRREADDPQAHRHSPQPSSSPASAFNPGDTVVLLRTDGGSSTILRKVPTKDRDDSVFIWPHVEIANDDDSHWIITYVRSVPSVRQQDSGELFALVRAQPKRPPLCDFTKTREEVHSVEGYVQLKFLSLKHKAVSGRSRSPSPPPAAPPAARQSSLVISIKTLTRVNCFYRKFKNDRNRSFAALLMLR